MTACLTPLFSLPTITKISSVYDELLKIVPAVHDNVGRVLTPERDPWDSRRGVAIFLKHVAETEAYDGKVFEPFFKFLVPKCLAEPRSVVRQIFYEVAAILVSHVSKNWSFQKY